MPYSHICWYSGHLLVVFNLLISDSYAQITSLLQLFLTSNPFSIFLVSFVLKFKLDTLCIFLSRKFAPPWGPPCPLTPYAPYLTTPLWVYPDCSDNSNTIARYKTLVQILLVLLSCPARVFTFPLSVSVYLSPGRYRRLGLLAMQYTRRFHTICQHMVLTPSCCLVPPSNTRKVDLIILPQDTEPVRKNRGVLQPGLSIGQILHRHGSLKLVFTFPYRTISVR